MRYLPNFRINESNQLALDAPRPRHEVRVDSYSQWLRDAARTVESKSHNVGLAYFGHERGGSWAPIVASTFFILGHNGKRVGVTALHSVHGTRGTCLLD